MAQPNLHLRGTTYWWRKKLTIRNVYVTIALSLRTGNFYQARAIAAHLGSCMESLRLAYGERGSAVASATLQKVFSDAMRWQLERILTDQTASGACVRKHEFANLAYGEHWRLDLQRKDEERRREDDQRRSRSVTFGGREIEGGVGGALQAVVDALQAGLASKAFQSRSGLAVLSPFPEGDERPPQRRTRGGSSKEPSFLSDQQRDLIGFAGEYAAYVHLKRTVRNFADEHWVSSLGRRYLGLMIVQDGGFDFRVPRWRGGLHYEVKAHIGDPGYIDLERSQVEAAVQFANEKDGIWRILYVAHVLDPEQIAVHELGNPFSEGNLRMFRPSSRQGVRLLIDRQ